MAKSANERASSVNSIGGIQGVGMLRGFISKLLGRSHSGKRDFYEVFGYPREILIQDLLGMYYRNDIATTIVSAYPQATWRDNPVIRDEAGDSSQKTDKKGKPNENFSPFVEAAEMLFKRMKVGHYLERVDRLSGIGRYGILLMGFQDAQPLSTPLNGKPKLIYLSPYGEQNVNVTRWDMSEQSPRFGLPDLYTLQKGNPLPGQQAQTKAVTVHHSRVLHVAEYLDDNEVFGRPRLLSVFNRLMDLEKVVGSSAETFWLNSRPGLGLWADKEAQLVEADIKDMKQQAEEFQHQLRRVLVGTGMTAQSLGATVADPEPNVDKLLDLIAGATRIPKRILIGSERGELASSQDENNWGARIDERRKEYATPLVLEPFVTKMIETGNLPAPKGQWWPVWPEAAAIGPKEKSEIARNRAEALRAYASTPNAAQTVPAQEFRRDFLEMEPDSEYEIEEAEPPEIDETDPDVQEQFNRRASKA